MKRYLLIQAVLAMFLTLSLFAGGQDSVTTAQVVPGVTSMRFVKSGPYVINVLVVDLSTKDLRVESYRPIGLVKTSQQARRNDRPGHSVIGATNADFFSFVTGWPVNNMVMNNQFVYATATQRSHLAIDALGKPFIDKFSLAAWIKFKNGRIYPIEAVNGAHRPDAIVLHNSFSDTATNSSSSGKTYALGLAHSSWSIGDTLWMAVTQVGVSDLAHIARDQAVLWIGDGVDVPPSRENVGVGDTVLVFLGTQPPLPQLRTMVGGVGMILSNGKFVADSINVEEKTNLNFLDARHPRTFVGFDHDSTKLFLCVVDGRQEQSIGMNFHEMATFLSSLGVWNALNLDGGGSTTMVICNEIANSPSDKTGERPVANSLQIVRFAPSSKLN